MTNIDKFCLKFDNFKFQSRELLIFKVNKKPEVDVTTLFLA